MKKFLIFSLISSGFIFNIQKAQADWDYWGYKDETETVNGHTDTFRNLYTINSATGVGTRRQRFCYSSNTNTMNTCHTNTGLPILQSSTDIAYPEKHIDKDTLIIKQKETDLSSNTIQKKYNLSGNTLTSETITSSATYWYDDYSYVQVRGAAQIDSDGNYYSDIGGQMWIKQTSDGTISFGKSGSSTAIYSLDANGVSQGGTNLISRTSDGITSIGANSVKLQEISDIQRIWATNSSGTKIPINIYGSDFQINGVSVQDQIDTNKSGISTNSSNIKNLGEGVAGSTALTAALTALPQTSKESKLSCGVGTGAYSSRYALGFGCASKVNERVDINAGGSYVFGGSKSYGDGTLDSGVIKAGFVFKLGELNKPTLISMNEKEKMEDKIYSLEEKNEKILSKNKKLEDKVSTLIARLERLEKVALNESKSQDLATIKLP